MMYLCNLKLLFHVLPVFVHIKTQSVIMSLQRLQGMSDICFPHDLLPWPAFSHVKKHSYQV